jgi:DNA-binding NarL/FixJ family response regulator
MSIRILIVDDRDVVRQGVRGILHSRAGWEICGEAENGIEALEKIAHLNPDVVVLDITMPGKDGLAVAAELAQSKPHCKAVVLTMHNSTELASAVQRAGAHGYVIKSHASRDLVRAIETVIEGGTFFMISPEPSMSQKQPVEG